MPRSVTALYRSRAEAESSRARLTAIGIDPAGITIEDEDAGSDAPQGGGIFDRLAAQLVPGTAAPGRFRLSAEVEPEQLDAAAEMLEQDRKQQAGAGAQAGEDPFVERTYVFREVSEEMVVEKQLVFSEEVVLRKDVESHVEEIHETVRRTEVEIEELPPGKPGERS